jgi:hypothetical protein
VPYKVYPIRTPVTEKLTLDVIAVATNVDTFVALYCAPYNPDKPLANLVVSDDDSAGYPHPRISANDNIHLNAGVTYYLVVTGYSNFAPYGKFSMTLGGSVQALNYTIASSMTSGNGFIVCTSPVEYGITAACSIKPSEYFLVSNVVVDGVSKGPLGSVTFPAVTADHTVAVTFVMDIAHRVRIPRPVPLFFPTLMDAYAVSAGGETIQAWGVEFSESLLLSVDKPLIVKGGFNQTYTTVTGMTGVQGTVSILKGMAVLDHIEVK